MHDAFVCDAIRTPFGRYGGALKDVRADDLAAVPIRALVERNNGVDWQALDDILYGCATSREWRRCSPICPPKFPAAR